MPDGSGAGRGGACAEPAAATPGVPTFTPTELHKQLDAVLGKGASGTVYSLRDFPGLAAKEIQLDGLDQRSIDAAKLELATLPALSHPGILRYHQAIEDDSFVYIVMDRHDTSLETLITKHRRRREPVPIRMIVTLAVQIAGALAYLSSASGVDARGAPFRGLVHRDLKPANILMNKDGERVVIADFGLCKDALRSGSTVAGTKPYMAPETLVYNSTSPASDIWSLGVIVYELAALKRPNFLEGKEPKDVFINGWKPDLSPVKDDFIRSILERIFVLDPAKRPTARELAELFQAHRTSSEGDSPPTTAWEAVLKDANARIAALERELHTNSSDICALRNTITTQTAEIDSLRKELKTKSAKIDALEQQFTRAIEALEEKTHRRETEMDQQLAQVRAEADQHKKELEALKLANEHADKHDEEASRVEKALTPEVVDDSGVTALMKAAMRCDVEAVRALITEQKRLGDRDGKTALMYAAQRDCKETVKVLLEYEKRMRDNQNHNALYHALKNGHTATARVIVPYEDPTDKNGVTALMRAAARGDPEMVVLLIPIQKGMKDRVGNTAFVHALKNKHVDVATLLRKHEAPSWTLLMCAAFIGDIELARSHLSDKDKKNGDGDTALMVAARAGHEDIVELLDPTDRDGVTALMRAVDRNDVEAVRALMPLQKGRKMIGDVTRGEWVISRGTALMRAAYCGRTEVVRLLIEHEGGIQDKAGETALMHAAWSGHAECVKLLLEKEAGMQNEDGMTALMWAVANNKFQCAELLAEREKNIKTTHGGLFSSGFPPGTTALDIAKEKGYTKLISILSGQFPRSPMHRLFQ